MRETMAEKSARFVERDQRICELWTCMSARDIGIEMGLTAQAVLSTVARYGLQSRPISAYPEN